jgi:hypothetical protein
MGNRLAVNSPVLPCSSLQINSGYIGLQVRDSDGNITELYQGIYTR